MYSSGKKYHTIKIASNKFNNKIYMNKNSNETYNCDDVKYLNEDIIIEYNNIEYNNIKFNKYNKYNKYNNENKFNYIKNTPKINYLKPTKKGGGKILQPGGGFKGN